MRDVQQEDHVPVAARAQVTVDREVARPARAADIAGAAEEVDDRPAARVSEPPLAGTDLSRRTASVVMIGIVAVGTVLRLWQIGSVGFNSDEAVYSGQGAALLGNAQMAQSFSLFRAHP